MLKNLKINTKLIAIFLLVGLIPLGTVGIISLTKSSAALEEGAFNQLTALRDVKKGQIEGYFQERQGDMGVLTQTVGTLRREAVKKLEAVNSIKTAQITTYFQERMDLMVDVQSNLRFTGGVVEFTKAFSRGGLNDPMYKALHDVRHPGLKSFNDFFGFYDVFLMDMDGNVIYTASGESDWGENLLSGRLSQSGLADAFKTGMKEVSITDFAYYEPSGGPAAFLSTPLRNSNGVLTGVAAVQISLEQINSIMGERTGMGLTGESYLVGPDHLMRSDSYLDPEGHSVVASFANNATVETEATTKALAGSTGADVIIDYNNSPVLSAYAPVKVGSMTWACLSEIDIAEAFSPRDESGTAFFQKYQEMYGYYDLFLINPDGYCFYSVTEEADYQTNLVNGTYASSNLGRLTRDVIKSREFGFADFAPYAPSNGEPAAFVAEPFVHAGKVELVVALQLPLSAINDVMRERSGMGETGETYLVGPDKLMRSDSYLDQQGHSVAASFAGTVERNGVDTEASQKALSGETDARIISDYNGNPVLSAFAPINVYGTKWAMIAEIDEWEAFEAASGLQMAIVIIAVAIAAVVVLIGWLFARSIARPISKIAGIAESISVGDIKHSIEVDSNDEIGMLGRSFQNLIEYMTSLADAAREIAGNNLTIQVEPKSDQDVLGNSFKTMTTNLTSMVHQISDNATQLVSAANEVATSSEQMSRGSRDQTDQVTQVSTAVEEMAATIVESSRNASDANEGSRSAADTASNGGQIVSETIQGMQTIAKVVRESSESIGKLATSADQIGEITSVIDDIADQTNLLALNAAIEAARAGEQGRGFAVVADEVRKLAERTGKATGEITDMIKGIQNETNEAVQSMEAGIQEVDSGRELADKAGSSLTEIVSLSQRVQDMIQQIATATEEQSTAAEQISKNVENVSAIARESATGAEQSAAAAEELNRQAEGMKEMVGQFRVR